VSRVAIATCAGTDVDPDSPVLLDALAEVGLAAELAVWDDPAVRWSSYGLVVVRSTWDYSWRRGEFLRWARSIGRLENPYEVLEYSSDKHYLGDLGRRGLRVVPSRFCHVGEEPSFPRGDFVVKPVVGAGSRDAARYHPDEVEEAFLHVAGLHGRGRDALIQPYVATVDDAGETGLVFIDGTFSHAVAKSAMLNVDELDRNQLFRLQQTAPVRAEPGAVDYAEAVLAATGFTGLLYARVDLVWLEGQWAVMELELVEPSLYLFNHPGAASRLAAAILARC